MEDKREELQRIKEEQEQISRDAAQEASVQARISQILKDKEREEAASSLAKSLGVSPDGLLGGAARSGLGATEAVNALNIQKSSLSELKKIEKNTRGSKISKAG